MKRHHILWLSGCIILFLACENEIDLNFEERPPRLIMNALINNDNDQNYLYLNMTGPYATANVKDATVEIQVNGELVETPQPDRFDWEGDYQLQFPIHSRFRPGDVVRIDARTPDGKHHAWAEVTAPQPATIVGVDTLSTRRLVNTRYSNNSWMDLLRYRITIKDRPQERNFYRLVVEAYDTVAVYIPDSLKTNILASVHNTMNIDEDVVLTDGRPSSSDDEMFTQPKNIYAVFDDHRFRDKDYTLNVYSTPLANTGEFTWYSWPDSYQVHYLWVRTRINIRLQSISEAEFRYLKILNVIDSDAYDEVLNEPITFPSNVHGGTGFVSISSSTSVTLFRNVGQKE